MKVSGQALISSLILMAVLSTVLLSYGEIAASRSIEALTGEKGRQTFTAAEAGLEEAMLRLERDANFAGATLVFDQTNVIIMVIANGSQRTLQSAAETDNNRYRRLLTAVVNFDSQGRLTVQSWAK